MAKFNMKSKRINRKPNEINEEGGEAFSVSDEYAFPLTLMTYWGASNYYRTSTSITEKIKDYISKLDPKYVMKCINFVRNKSMMRTATHIAAAEFIHANSGIPNMRNFISSVCVRPDDAGELLAYFSKNFPETRKNGKLKFPTRLKFGIRDAFNKWDNYQIEKYTNSGAEFSLVDIVNICGPIPTERNRDSLKKLVNDELKQKNTRSALLSEAGKSEDKDEAKSNVWKEMINSGRIGYMELVKNIKNIITVCDDETYNKAVDILADTSRIKGSKILPFRFFSAFRTIQRDLANNSRVNKVLKVLSNNFEWTSIENVAKLYGNTLVVSDVSGSMGGSPVAGGDLSCIDMGIIFGLALAIGQNAEFSVFATNYIPITIDPTSSVFGNYEKVRSVAHQAGGGTDFNCIFKGLKKKYDRIIILTDEQGWIGGGAPVLSFKYYKNNYNADPKIICIDLAHYGTIMFPEKDIALLGGFSDIIFDLINIVDTNPKALIAEINNIKF